MFQYFREISQKLKFRILVFTGIAMLPLLLLITFNTAQERHRLTEAAQTEALRLAQVIASNQKQYVILSEQLVEAISLMRLVRTHDTEVCNSVFARLLKDRPYYTNIFTFNTEGELKCSGVPPTNNELNVAGTDWFIASKQAQDLYMSDYEIGSVSGLPSVTMTYPIYTDEGTYNGVVGVGLSLNWLNSFVGELELPTSTNIGILDDQGTILAIYPYVAEAIGINSAASPIFQEAVERGEGVTQGDGIADIPRLYGYTHVEENGRKTYVIITLLEEIVYADLNVFLRNTIILLGLTSLVVLLLQWFGSEILLMRPVKNLVDTTIQVKSGDLSARANANYGVFELDSLAHRFNEMTLGLQERERLLENSNKQLVETNDTLAQEIEERKRMTRQLEMSYQELEQFAYVASHDLQEPLRVIAGYLQLIERRYKGKLDSDADEFIAFAVDAAKRMQFLINDLLVYSRIGRKSKPFDQISGEKILQEALDNLRFTIEEQQAVITHDPLPELVVDASQIVLVFQNLISNALKFRGADQPCIHIGLTDQEDHWVFCVKDNGIGIDPQFSNRIFLIFQRLHTREEYAGTGIGLAICQKIVDYHGGRIWVESQPGQGSTFFFTLSKQLRTNTNERETR